MNPRTTLFSAGVSKTILDKLESKGWRAYEKEPITLNTVLSPEESIAKASRQTRRGPVNQLKIDTPYVILPLVDDSSNPDIVLKALHNLIGKTGCPSIDFRGRLPWSGFALHEDEVDIYNTAGDPASYESFINALDTIIDSRTGKYDEPMKVWERN